MKNVCKDFESPRPQFNSMITCDQIAPIVDQKIRSADYYLYQRISALQAFTILLIVNRTFNYAIGF